MNRFKHCTTEEELSAVYKAEAKRVHPDLMGGDHSAFIALREEYEAAKAELKERLEKEQKRKQMMRTLGAIGRIMTDISEERMPDAESVKQILPKTTHSSIDIINEILKR